MSWSDPIGALVGFFKAGVPTLVEDVEPLPVTDSASRAATIFTTGGTPLTAVGPSTTIGLLDGSAKSMMDFQFTFAGGGNMTVAVQGTNNPAAAIGDAVSANGWASLELHGLNGGRTSTVRNTGRQVLQNVPRFVRVYCTQYVSGSCGVNGITKPVPEPDTQRYITDQDGLARWALTTFGQGQVAQRLYLIGGNFDDEDEFSDRWTDGSTSGGSLTHLDGLIELHTGTDPAGHAVVESQKLAEFLGAVDNATTMRIKIGSVPADASYGFRFGQYDVNNGWFIEVDATGYLYKFRKNGVDSVSPFGTLGVATVTPNTNINLWETIYNPNFVIIRNSNNFVQILIGNATFTPMFSEYDLPLRAEAFNSGSTADHVLSIQTLTTERLGQQASSEVDTSPLGLNSFDMENGSPAPTNAAPWVGVRESVDEYVQQTIVFDREPMSAFGVVHFYYAKTKDGTASVSGVPIDVVAGIPFVPYPLANVGNWISVDFVPDVASPAITNARLFVQKFKTMAPDITRNLGQTVYESEPVKSQQAVIMGAPPDYDDNPKSTAFQRVRVGDRHTLGSLSTLLDANEDIAGKWFRWLGTYTSAMVEIEADVAGTWRLEFSEEDTPVEFADEVTPDESVQGFTNTFTYDPANGIDPRGFVTQSLWVRLKYYNGVAAQSEFSGDIAYLTTPLASGIKHASEVTKSRAMVTMTDAITTSRTQESVDGSEEYIQDRATLNSTTGLRGKNAHVTDIDVPVGIRPMTSGNTSQVVCGTSAWTRLDPSPLTNRKSVMFSNMEKDVVSGGVITYGNAAVWSHDDSLSESGGFDLPVQLPIALLLDASVPVYVRAKATGAGTTNTQVLSGTTSSGTATNPANGKVLDSVYANIAANGQIDDIAGYSITPTLSTVQNVKLRVVGKKQASQFQTVAHQETVQGNNTSNSGSVTSASINGGATMAYVAAIVRRGAGTVTSVAGLGLTWTQVTTVANGSNRSIDLWVAYGTGTTGTVTATLSLSNINSITVSRFTGADPTVFQDSDTGTGNTTTPTTPALTSTVKGMVVFASADNNKSSTPAAGYTEQTEVVTGERMQLSTKPIVATGTETPTCTLSGADQWAAAGLTILPAASADPQITLSYKLSGVAGASSSTVTFVSTSNATFDLDVTGDRVWAFTDVPNVDVIGTGLSIDIASADIDALQLVVVETSSPTARICLHQGAHPDG